MLRNTLTGSKIMVSMSWNATVPINPSSRLDRGSVSEEDAYLLLLIFHDFFDFKVVDKSHCANVCPPLRDLLRQSVVPLSFLECQEKTKLLL